MKSYIDRKKSSEILELLKQFPAVAILGPRQAGKSTLISSSLVTRVSLKRAVVCLRKLRGSPRNDDFKPFDGPLKRNSGALGKIEYFLIKIGLKLPFGGSVVAVLKV